MQTLNKDGRFDANDFQATSLSGALRRKLAWLICFLGGGLELLALHRARRQR